MNPIKSFVKATLVGGLMFLVPVVLVVVVLRHALQFAGKIAEPLAAALPVSHVGGVAIATIIAVAVLLCIAFFAGMLSRTGLGRRITHWFEESIMGGLPQYRMVKSLAEGLTQLETSTGMQPVLMRGDEGWMLGYQMEELPAGWRVVFLPASPTPMSGNVMYVEASRVQPLDLSMRDAMQLVKRLGIGSAEKLRGTNLAAGTPS
ncbi:MAG: DUF502 domain-containing protein [Steroidobacteraceae bacterium]|nr:DUF502 domain-containing protein [Steroidobacteraceae bacterium]